MKQIILITLLFILMKPMNSQNIMKVNDVKGINIGAKAPMFNAMSADSNIFSLENQLNSSSVVIIFYRGFWCPYCNRHLKSIQDSLSLITEQGVNVIAISPEKPEYLERMADKTGAQFMLLYDEDYKISDAFDLTFTPEKKQLMTYNVALKGNLRESHSDDTQRLPIPATFIIDKNGIIVWRQFDLDYKKRSTVEEILQNLPKSEN